MTAYQHKLHIDHSQAPIDYELKVSARAKRITLRVVPGRGLVVSVPSNFSGKSEAVDSEHTGSSGGKRPGTLSALATARTGTPGH